MAVKAVEMVRKIRDRHYKETKGRPVAEQNLFVRKKAEKLQKQLAPSKRGSSSGQRLVRVEK